MEEIKVNRLNVDTIAKLLAADVYVELHKYGPNFFNELEEYLRLYEVPEWFEGRVWFYKLDLEDVDLLELYDEFMRHLRRMVNTPSDDKLDWVWYILSTIKR